MSAQFWRHRVIHIARRTQQSLRLPDGRDLNALTKEELIAITLNGISQRDKFRGYDETAY